MSLVKWQTTYMCIKSFASEASLKAALFFKTLRMGDMLLRHAFGTFTPDFRTAEARPQKLMIAQGHCANMRQTRAKCGRFFLKIAFICAGSLCLPAQSGLGC